VEGSLRTALGKLGKINSKKDIIISCMSQYIPLIVKKLNTNILVM